MTPEQLIYLGQYWTALHKNKIFQYYLRRAFIIYVETKYLG